MFAYIPLFFGFIVGVIGSIIMFLIIGIFTKPNRSKRPAFTKNTSPTKKRETASWLNIIFARLNSSRIDSTILGTICSTLTKEILSDPHRPEALTEVNIVPLKPPAKSPLFTDFVIKPNDSFSTLSFCVQYQGQPSLAIYCSSSGGAFDFPKLFTIKVQIELLVKLLVAKISLSFDEHKNAVLNIGNDLIVELEFRPLFEGQVASQRHVESISYWLSNLILKNLRGKTFPILLGENGGFKVEEEEDNSEGKENSDDKFNDDDD
ncbi:hypothetical protein TRFO_40493 [Tritrichomonas foetus]|uniref:SMP-LTD domain-containing protein n=1 Tax=Tritrichomonas foetus TaxID=1144522 RepID=A0A1J4J3A3_9EUKA|nr:hypothetical protein TRFO_40493 [Tritrichomonas foetus]|eukprot:OHS93225.1 hypothetical protein TRFO_40493 [Tritrichomonas foetus]